MFKFYTGQLKLKNEKVIKAAQYSAEYVTEMQYKAYTPQIFERYINQVMYFYSKPDMIKNDMTVLFVQGWIMNVHPGTSRFLAYHLSGAEYIPVLGVFNQDLHLEQSLTEYLKDPVETDNYFYSREAPCYNTFHLTAEDKSVLDQDWYERERVRDFMEDLLWSKSPNIEWYNPEGQLLCKRIKDETKTPIKETIQSYSELWQSLIEISKN